MSKNKSLPNIHDLIKDAGKDVRPAVAALRQRFIMVIKDGKTTVEFIPEDILVITSDYLPIVIQINKCTKKKNIVVYISITYTVCFLNPII